MKQMKFFVPVILFVTSIISCKKEDCPVPPNYTGKWVGKYGTGANPPNLDYTFFLNADGELGVIDGLGTTPQAKGTWTVIGNTFRGTYKYLPGGSVFSVQATISTTAMTNGTYGNNDVVSGAGTFTMTKQ